MKETGLIPIRKLKRAKDCRKYIFRIHKESFHWIQSPLTNVTIESSHPWGTQIRADDIKNHHLSFFLRPNEGILLDEIRHRLNQHQSFWIHSLFVDGIEEKLYVDSNLYYKTLFFDQKPVCKMKEDRK